MKQKETESQGAFLRLDMVTDAMIRDLMKDMHFTSKIECVRYFIRQAYLERD